MICLWALLCPAASFLPAQVTVLSGQVVSANKAFITGADLVLLRCKKQLIAGEDGRFSFSSVSLPDTLLVSAKGYATSRVLIKTKLSGPLQILLKERHTSARKFAPIGIGDTVPALVLQHVINSPSRSIALKGFKGLTIIDFWATWWGMYHRDAWV